MLERGIKQPSLNTIHNLARAFGLKNSELLHLVEMEIHTSEATTPRDPEREAEEKRILSLETEQEQIRIGEIANRIPVVFFSRTPMPEYAPTFISRNIQHLVGFSSESFMDSGKFWLDHVHPDDQLRIHSQLMNIRAEELLCHQYRFLTANGAWMQIREELRPIADADGHTTEILGSMTGDPCGSSL